MDQAARNFVRMADKRTPRTAAHIFETPMVDGDLTLRIGEPSLCGNERNSEPFDLGFDAARLRKHCKVCDRLLAAIKRGEP